MLNAQSTNANAHMLQARTTGARTNPHPRNPTRPTASYPRAGGVDRRKTQRDRPTAARAPAAERDAESGGPPEERPPTPAETAHRGGGGPPHTPHGWGGAPPYATPAAKRHPLRGVPACGTHRRPLMGNAQSHERRRGREAEHTC